MSSASSPEKLIRMANQIGDFFQSQGPKIAVSGTAEHIKKFWDPRMLKSIFAYVDSDGTALKPHVREAIVSLKPPAV